MTWSPKSVPSHVSQCNENWRSAWTGFTLKVDCNREKKEEQRDLSVGAIWEAIMKQRISCRYDCHQCQNHYCARKRVRVFDDHIIVELVHVWIGDRILGSPARAVVVITANPNALWVATIADLLVDRNRDGLFATYIQPPINRLSTALLDTSWSFDQQRTPFYSPSQFSVSS